MPDIHLTDDDSPRRRGNGFNASIVLQLLGVLAAVFVAYSAINARVSVLETRYDEVSRRLADIDNKLDRLLLRP